MNVNMWRRKGRWGMISSSFSTNDGGNAVNWLSHWRCKGEGNSSKEEDDRGKSLHGNEILSVVEFELDDESLLERMI
jgi:hypothetical protein